MNHRRLRSFPMLVSVACLALAWVGPSLAAERYERPRIFAVTGATIVTAPGRTIDGGTIVIRDGLIEAVGRGVRVPADAVEIDGDGRRVYPGLIDADGTIGQARAGSPAAGGAGRAGRPATPESRPDPTGAVHPLQRVHPERAARDRLRPFSGDAAADAEQLRGLGFTVVLTRPDSGILRGSSAAILLADDRSVAQMLLRDDVAQHAAFERGRFGEGYPTSLMGAAAAIRQTLLDARRHAEWSSRHDADPRGMSRPERHDAFEALAPVVDGTLPLIVHTDHARDTLLARRIADELSIEMIIATSSWEWELAERIAADVHPLIVSLRRPDKPKVKQPHDALEVDLLQMQRYLDSVAGPSRLHAAGVSFALTTHGMKNRAEFPKRMRETIEAGLDTDSALAALTTIPARLLGVERMVGTLEPGKIANLIVADGPLFGEQTQLSDVFVDGVRYEIKVKQKLEGDPDAIVDPRGTWSIVIDAGGRTMNRTWTIEGRHDNYGGTSESPRGSTEFDRVELAGNVLTVVLPARGDRPPTEVSVLVEGDSLEGTIEIGPRSAELSGTRTAGPDGGAR